MLVLNENDFEKFKNYCRHYDIAKDENNIDYEECDLVVNGTLCSLTFCPILNKEFENVSIK